MAPKRLITEGVGEETGNVCVNVTSLNILNMPHILRFFSLQDAVYFIMLSFLVPVIFTF